MGVYDEQLNLFESSDDGAFLRTIKRILRKSKYSITNNLKLTIYSPGEIMESQEEMDVKSLYPKINIPQETKSTTQAIIEDMVQKRNEIKQNNSFDLKKIKVFLPGDLYNKNKEKDFKHLELFLDLPNDPWRDVCFKPTSGRSILITVTDEPGYSYKPINFSMYDLSDEEFDEFLKIFNLQGSCTSKISLCD